MKNIFPCRFLYQEPVIMQIEIRSPFSNPFVLVRRGAARGASGGQGALRPLGSPDPVRPGAVGGEG